MSKRQMIAPSEIARSVLLYVGRPSPELKYACARYLASLNTTEARREAALQTPPEERQANARVAIAARWSRPRERESYDQQSILARVAVEDPVTIPAKGVRRRAALDSLVAAGADSYRFGGWRQGDDRRWTV